MRYFWLSAQQMRLIEPFFPKDRWRARSDDCKVLSGIIYVKRYGLSGGRMRQRSMDLTKPCITGLAAGPGWMSSRGCFARWRSPACRAP